MLQTCMNFIDTKSVVGLVPVALILMHRKLAEEDLSTALMPL